MYLAAGSAEKAIPLLVELFSQEPGWTDGPSLLAQAYTGAGRDAEATSVGTIVSHELSLAAILRRTSRLKMGRNSGR